MLEGVSREDKAFLVLKEILEEEQQANVEKYKFFTGSLDDLNIKGLDELMMLSIYDGHIVGYMGCIYNIPHDKIISLDFIFLGDNLTERKEFLDDFAKFCSMLDKLYKKIELNIVPESPAYKLAMKFFKRYNFRKVGTFRKARKILDKFYDVEAWEKEER